MRKSFMLAIGAGRPVYTWKDDKKPGDITVTAVSMALGISRSRSFSN
jgi:predicted lipoprotein with Yx(FWY)xxD motif